jgi:hypothetical protein
MRAAWLLFSFLTASNAQIPAELQAKLDLADRQIVRLSPTTFTELPSAIVFDLQKRDCTVPQVPEIAGRHNVIRGEFAKPGQQDWAVLCSVNRVSSILVFWDGSVANPAMMEPVADIDRLQSWTEGKTIFSRVISGVDAKYILEHFNAYGGPTPPPLDHLGIDDAFWGKASVVRYFHEGKWLQLQGAD